MTSNRSKFRLRFMDRLPLSIVVVASILFTPAGVLAHQSGCHRWHSCPSDSGSYICGDTGYCSGCPNNYYCQSCSYSPGWQSVATPIATPRPVPIQSPTAMPLPTLTPKTTPTPSRTVTPRPTQPSTTTPRTTQTLNPTTTPSVTIKVSSTPSPTPKPKNGNWLRRLFRAIFKS